MVRNEQESGPWIPGVALRFQWVGENHPDQKMIREGVQDNGRNLFVLRLPMEVAGSEVKVLAVGFYPDELQSASWAMCDPRQRSDWNDGRMVILKTLEIDGFFEYGGGYMGSVYAYCDPLNDEHIAEIKRNNRNARQDLRRKTTVSYLEQEIKDAVQEKEDKIIDESEFVGEFTERWFATEHHVKGNPRVSGYTGRSK